MSGLLWTLSRFPTSSLKCSGFSTDKCKVLHLGRNNRHHTYRLGNSPLVSTEAEKDLGVITDSKMNMGQQCGDAVGLRKADRTLSCIHRCISSRSREVILPLHAALVRPQREDCVRLWAPHCRRDVDGMERGQRRPLAWSGAAGQALRGETTGPEPAQPPKEKAEGESGGHL